MKNWYKKITYSIAVLASFFIIEEGIKESFQENLVLGYQGNQENIFYKDTKENFEDIELKEREVYQKIELGEKYQLKENGVEVIFESSGGMINIYEDREGEKIWLQEEEINSPLWLSDIDGDGYLEIVTNNRKEEGSFYDWEEEENQFIKGYQKYILEPEKFQELLFINKNTKVIVPDIQGATYYELSIYDEEEGKLLQSIKYPFVEDEWSVFNNFSFLDVNFDEYIDLSISFQREYTYGSPLDFLFYWNPEKREFENALEGDMLENPYENAVCLYEIDKEKEWMLVSDPLGTGCREERLYKFINNKLKCSRVLYIADLVVYPVDIYLEDRITGEIILDDSIPREEFYEREQEFYDMFYQGMSEEEI